jgi:hypothetical protein
MKFRKAEHRKIPDVEQIIITESTLDHNFQRWCCLLKTRTYLLSIGFMIPLESINQQNVKSVMYFVLGGLVVYLVLKTVQDADSAASALSQDSALDILNNISVQIKPLTEASVHYISKNPDIYREAVINIYAEVEAACVVLNASENLYTPYELTNLHVIPTYLLIMTSVIILCIPLNRVLLTKENSINMSATLSQAHKPNFTKHVHFFISPNLAKKSLLDKMRFFIYIQNCIIYGILLLPFRFSFFVYLYEHNLLYAIIPIFCGHGGLPYCFINLGFWCLLYRIELTSRIMEKDSLLLKDLSIFFTKMRRSPLSLVRSIGRVGGLGGFSALANGGGPRGSGWGVAAALIGTLGVAGMNTYKDYKLGQLKAKLKHEVALHRTNQQHAQASQAQTDSYNRGVYNDETKAYNERSIFSKGKPPQPPKTR